MNLTSIIEAITGKKSNCKKQRSRYLIEKFQQRSIANRLFK
ncbi:hypothetical protein [Christiangramia antarctica]|uniref:Uncharacterized protein n=1 Tax=Christiangramia antarctica TaxID=2058158 RepID=A0ABW5X1V4_9FLAO